MKSRHTAALALVGWYLITYANPSAPTAEWSFYNELRLTPKTRPTDKRHAKEFESKAACEAKKDQVCQALSLSSTARGGDIKAWVDRHNSLRSRTICVSSDDPRLKQ
jgi:hypothetical protein